MAPKLSTEMRRIINAEDRYIEVGAGPGTGKTSLLVELVREAQKADPDQHITALSFSNASVNNMIGRLTDARVSTANIKIQTCHASALALGHRKKMSRPADKEGSREQSAEDDAAASHYAAMLRSGIRWLQRNLEAKRQSATARKAKLGKRERAPRTKQTKEPKQKASERREQQAAYVDLDIDLLLVDEFQDCTPEQTQFVALLARHANAVVVVGDRRQSIFGFGGAVYTPLNTHLPKTRLMPLSISFRLTDETAALANAIAKPLGGQPIQTGRKGKRPLLVTAPDTTTQARDIAERVGKLIRAGISPDRIAIIGRNRSTARPAAQALRSAGIATTLLGTPEQTGHLEDVLNVLSVVSVVEDLWAHGADMSRQLETMTTKRGSRQAKRWFVARTEKALTETLDRDALATGAKRWTCFVAEIVAVARNASSALESRYRQCADAYVRLQGGIYHARALYIDLQQWTPRCRDFPDAAPMHAAVQATIGQPAVTTTNIHRAKGREWDHVFVVGVTDGILPHYKAEGSSLMQERALLYVAVTRARKRVWLCHAPTYSVQGRDTFDQLSTLLSKTALKTMKRVDI